MTEQFKEICICDLCGEIMLENVRYQSEDHINLCSSCYQQVETPFVNVKSSILNDYIIGNMH